MYQRETLLNIDEDSRKEKRRERAELQKELYVALTSVVLLDGQPAQPTDEKLRELEDLLNDPRWIRLQDLVEEMKFWDAATTIPKLKSFLYNARQQAAIEKLLANTATSFPYLKLIIKHFQADNERIEPDLNAPIHYAVRQLNDEFLDWLLNECQQRLNVNLRNNQKETALGILCALHDECMKGANRQNHSMINKLGKIRHQIGMLLAAGADFNICSMQLKLPFELLLKHYQTDESTGRFVDRCVQDAGHALAIGHINKRIVEFHNKESPVKVTEELLEICLRYNDQQSFLHYISSFTVTEQNVKTLIEIVLHTAVEQKLSECVRKIVDLFGSLIFQVVIRPMGRDAQRMKLQKSSELVHRVELKGLLKKACLMGDVLIVQLFMGRMTDLLVLNDDPLLALTLTKGYDSKRRTEDREALLAVAGYLATQQNIYMSKPDNSGNTPLHLALKYGFNEIATTLLKQRYAYIGLRNRDNLTPLDYGGYGFWKTYLDSCIEVDSERSAQDRNVLRFNLNCLEPYKSCRKPATGVITAASAKTASASALAGQPKESGFRVIQDASKVKQQPHKYARVQTEMTVIRQIAESKELKRLLIHPVIYTFIMVKWIRLSHWTYLNLLLTVTTMLVFGWHSLDACSLDGSPALPLQIFTVLGALFIVIREVLQLLFLRKSYITFENAMDIGNIIAMVVVLSQGCNGLLSSFLMISFAMQLTFLLGSLPFNTLSTIMYMFKTVSQNFLKSFLLFLPLIGSFIYAFYLTYNDTLAEPTSANSTINTSSTEDNFNNFRTFWNATIKTLVMTTGEFEAAAIDFSGGKLLLFMVFLFFAPIVILNLINGLAVSDIAAIREESELISISKKVMLLERYERGVVNVPLAWMKRKFPEPFFERHNCWIHIRTDQFRKIFIHVLNPPVTSSTAAPKKEKPTPISLSSCSLLWPNGTDKLINLRLFKLTSFLTLDSAIANEALAVIERKLLSTKQPTVMEATAASLQQPMLTGGNAANAAGRTKHTVDLEALQSEVRELRITMDRWRLELQGMRKEKLVGRKQQKTKQKKRARQKLSEVARDM
ncbi:transient receptor potential cation channel subfamily A member 1-like [Anopheles albimanus]|uniref:Ion transport domain-containing protein n=1 Tax=Anopheles albimanus TaxID=7167 RepID=A0A182FK39_ANOAL|nr:transient receptor potential cation channel subfamily A member 1-like [Anopheles albimanus]